MDDFEKFYTACVEALYFTETGDKEQPAADAEMAEETKEYLRADCLSFWRRFGCYVDAAAETPEQAGHDFWLTRNGHGSGFWDGDWPEPYDQILTEGAKCYGEFDVFEGESGRICS